MAGVQPLTIMRHPLHQLLALVCSAVLVLTGFAAETKKSYDLPAGEAAVALKKFSEVSGHETLFAAEVVRGVRTRAVKGEFSAREALEALLSDTGLAVTQDAKTGVFAVRRDAGPNDHGAVPPSDNRPAGRPLVADGMVTLEEFTVHGVRVPGPVNEGVIARSANGAVAFQIFDRTAIERSGATSLGEFFRGYSGNTSNGLGFQSSFGNATNLASGPGDTADRINLRGLGNSRTVVLLNGRRLYGSDSLGPDVSRIPLSAVERVEILPGAGAAIYGANAVGGAVNIITRRNYNILELTGYLGTSTGGGATEWRGTVYYGFSLNEGRTSGSVILEHTDRGELRAGDREFYRDALNVVAPDHPLYRTINSNSIRTPRALITATVPLQLPGNPAATVTSVPVGYNSANPAAADFAATAGQIPLSFRRVGSVLLQPAVKIDSVNFQGEHRFIKDRLEAYTELAWRYQVGRNSLPGIGGNASLTATSPLNPFRANPAAGRPAGVAVGIVWDPVDVPFDESYTLQRTLRLVGGLKGKLGAGKRWAWALDYSYDRNEGYSTYLQRTSSLVDAVALGVYNPFRDLERFPHAINLADYTTTNINRSIPEIYVANARLSGDLWRWRAGRVALSLGAESRQEEIKSVGVQDASPLRRLNNPAAVALLAPFSNGQTRAEREARSVYAELTVPLLGGDFRLPFAEALELSLAARHEAYGSYGFRSTFGTGLTSTVQPGDISDTPLTAAVLWRPVPDVSFRASYSDAFVSPTMSQLFAARTVLPLSSPVTFFDPVFGATVVRPAGSITVTSGGNPFIRPESGRAYNYGVIVTPRLLPGLTVSADLYHVVSYDQIRTPTVQTVVSFFPGRVTRDATNNVTAYDTSAINMSQVVVGGADFRVAYDFRLAGVGDFNWQGTATYTDYYKQKAIIGNPFLAGVGDRTLDSGVPQRLKGSTSLTLTRDAWSASLTGRYVGRYKDAFNSGLAVPNTNGGIDGEFVRAQLEFDLRLTYDFGEGGDGWRRALRQTRVALGALNVFDRRPPYLSANNGAANYSYYNDPRMRYVYLELKRKF